MRHNIESPTVGKCWDNKENRILNIKKENENKKEKQKTEIPKNLQI